MLAGRGVGMLLRLAAIHIQAEDAPLQGTAGAGYTSVFGLIRAIRGGFHRMHRSTGLLSGGLILMLAGVRIGPVVRFRLGLNSGSSLARHRAPLSANSIQAPQRLRK